MTKSFESYYRAEEEKNPMTKKDKDRDKANREHENRMLAEESRRLKKENTPEFKAKVEKAIRGGGSGGAASDTREMQLGSELDPKAMMKRSGMKKGGKVKSASSRADGIAQRGKTRGKMV